MLELFRQKYTPESLPYHLVVPSLPGFTLSSGRPLNHDISQVDVARIMDKLMKQIGFGEGYVAQGGDVGSRVARILAVDSDACKGKASTSPGSLKVYVAD
jgi:microsomal epoxide hydrolase